MQSHWDTHYVLMLSVTIIAQNILYITLWEYFTINLLAIQD